MLQPGEKVDADLGYCGDLSKIRYTGVSVLYANRRAKQGLEQGMKQLIIVLKNQCIIL